jgi:hypothetical protein
MTVKNKIFGSLGVLLFILMLPALAHAKYKYTPGVGLWFGPTAPLFSTNDTVDGYLGGGLFHRANLPLNNFSYSFDTSYLHFNSNVEKRLDVFPVTLSAVYELPLSLPVKLLFKAGGGMSYVYIRPEKLGGWDPTLHLGSEFYFPAGDMMRIGLRVDFMWLYERHINSGTRWVYENGSYAQKTGAQRDGFILNMGLMVNFRFTD